MYARTTIARFQPGALEEVTSILRDVVLPSASKQQGFRGALVMGDPHMNRGMIITLWETENDLATSKAPKEIAAHVEKLGTLIAESTQETHQVLLQMRAGLE